MDSHDPCLDPIHPSEATQMLNVFAAGCKGTKDLYIKFKIR